VWSIKEDQRSRGGVTTYVEDEVRAGAMSATDPGAANRLRGDQPKGTERGRFVLRASRV
jgi:hypothetical protein